MFSPVRNVFVCLCFLPCFLVPYSRAQRRLCGRVLADTLDFVCEGRGFHLGKRSVDNVVNAQAKRSAQTLNDDSSSDFLHPSEGGQNGPENALPPNTDSYSHAGKKPLFGSWLSQKNGASANAMDKHGSGMSDTGTSDAGSDSDSVSQLARRQKRHSNRQANVVDECCRNACTLQTLESYCAAPTDPEQQISVEALRQSLGLGQTTRRPGRYPLRRPDAEINTDTNRTSSYFWVNLGQRPTRSPLF